MKYFTLKQEWQDYEPGTTYIYIIKNSTNDKVYIGQTKDLYQAWDDHKANIQKTNDPLYAAMRKIGVDKFKLTNIVKANADPVFINDIQDAWMNYYDSVKHGYNQSYNTNLFKKVKIETEQDIAFAYLILELPEMYLMGVLPWIRNSLNAIGCVNEEERELFFKEFYNKHKNNYRNEKAELIGNDLLQRREGKVFYTREELTAILNNLAEDEDICKLLIQNMTKLGFSKKDVQQVNSVITQKD